MDRISQNTIYAFILTRSKLGLSHISFALLYESYDLRHNFVSVQYLVNKWTEFHQTVYNYQY